jgi:hypothetical protein
MGPFCHGRAAWYPFGVGDEAENLVIRLLQEMRADMATKSELAGLRKEVAEGFRAARADTSDLRRDVSEGFSRTAAALTTLARRLDEVDQGVRLADR